MKGIPNLIHQYKLNGYDIVLDVFSGSVHVVDDVAYDIIAMYEDSKPEDIVKRMAEVHPGVAEEEILECIDDIKELVNAGKLFTRDEYGAFGGALKEKSDDIKALCLHVAHTCNLTCSYCFAGQGRYRGKDAVMSFETGKRALDFLVEHSGSRHNLEVDFFGGEPLVNWKTVKELVAYARSIEKDAKKHFRFTLTTNGMLIDDDVIDFCNREMDNVVLSLDGRKEVHDRFRVTPSGEGSYDTVVPKFKALVESRGERSYYMRGTYTRYNTDFASDVIHMAELGFSELSMEPVVADPKDPCALREEDLPELFRQYEILADYMIKRRKEGRPITFYHYMIDLQHGPCIYKRLSGCGSGTEYMAVTPAGELYPCHQFVGDERYLMGNIRDGVTNTSLRDEFASCNVYARSECENCWAKLYCSGGCAANSYHASGDIKGIYDYGCRLFRKRMECAIMLKVDESLGQNRE